MTSRIKSNKPTGFADDRRRDETLLRMLKTPPKPHGEMKVGKPRKAKKPSSESKKTSR